MNLNHATNLGSVIIDGFTSSWRETKDKIWKSVV